MKFVKTFGLMLLAIGALVAFAVSGTATATVLCTATESPCSETNLIGKEGEVHAGLQLGTTAQFQTTAGNPISQCTGSTLTSSVLNPGGAGAGVVLSWALAVSGCSSSVSPINPGEFETNFITGTDNGTVTARNTFPLKMLGVTIPATGCTYKFRPGSLAAYLTGGSESPRFDVYGVLTYVSGGLCLEDITWKGTYIIEEPSAIYVGNS